MSTEFNLIAEIRHWLWPSYRKPDVSGMFVRIGQTPTVAAVPKPKDKYTTIGYNQDKDLVKARVFEFAADGSTEFADIITVNKANVRQRDVVKDLTAADKQQLSKRKPFVSVKAATVIKEVFAAKGGAIASSELQDATGYSKAYCDVCLASFRAALSIERGETLQQH